MIKLSDLKEYLGALNDIASIYKQDYQAVITFRKSKRSKKTITEFKVVKFKNDRPADRQYFKSVEDIMLYISKEIRFITKSRNKCYDKDITTHKSMS